jgi:enoyl-CoA hydratase
MKNLENLLLTRSGNIQTITINRESKLNALNQATLAELKSVILSLYDDREIRGVILTGSGEKSFVAGADISEFANLNDVNARKFAEEGQEIFRLIENSPIPTVAVVNGFALGGGCELAMACHMRVAVKTAKFGQPEVNLGIIPGYGGTQRLSQLIGKGRAFEYMMSAEIIDANKAYSWGLVNHIEESKADAIAKAEQILNTISGKAPIAIKYVIDCVNAAFNPTEKGYQIEANAFSKCCSTSDFKEGASAFLEKRKPNFTGS